jgi:hypothetical protein
VVKVPLVWAGLDLTPLLPSGLFTTIRYDVLEDGQVSYHQQWISLKAYLLLLIDVSTNA